MKYDFIDIGCGYADTSVDTFGLNARGLLVEPLEVCCKVLPRSETVTVECSAVANQDGISEFTMYDVTPPNKYYTHDELLNAWNLNDTKNESFFLFLSSLLPRETLVKRGNIRNFQQMKPSKTIEVNTLTLKSLFDKYSVTEINQLKIDVEGFEESIIQQLIPLLKNGLKVNTIIYEYNEMSIRSNLDILEKQICTQFGYNSKYQFIHWNEDKILTKITS